ncbi:MAG: ABC transporter permease subunit [Gammaproteobacteria bacterium]
MLIFTIAARELRSMFLSPLAWSILAVVQLIIGYMFLINIDGFRQVQPRLAGLEGAPGVTSLVIAPLLGSAAVVLLLVVPMMTMRLISEERRNQTLSLLFSAPLSMTQIVLGKYLGLLGFLLIMLGMIALMPLSLLLGGSIDLGQFAAGLLGLALLLASFAAVGLFMSTLTTQPTVAAISTFGVLLLLWILDWAGAAQANAGDSLFTYLSLVNHYEALLRGVFRSSDVIYYLLFIISFLVLSIRRLDAYRLQH